MAIISIPNSIGGISIPGNVVKGPLGALFGNKYNLSTLRYPLDLESATRSHVVKFSINEVIPVGYKEGKTYDLGSAISGVGGAVVDTAKGAGTDLWNNTLGQLGFVKLEKKENVELSLEPRKKRQAAIINLYMPDTVTFNYTQSYGTINLTDIAAGVAGSALDGLMGSFKDKQGKKLFTSSGSGKNELVGQSAKLLMKMGGLAINPNQQLLFDGIDLRTFQLAFTFTPYSKQEADEVKRIIEMFKLHARPRTVSGTGGMLFIPPSTFDISFLIGQKNNPYINKVAESVITDIDVNYAPNGWAPHSDGAPVQTTLTMNFKELYLIDRDGETSIKKGF